MTREFIILQEFDKQWKKCGLNDDNLKDLQFFLCNQPDAGDIIQGSGGLRKLRWALPGKGKSGSIRTLYIDFISYEKLYLISCFKKNVQANINQNQKNQIKKLIKTLLDELRRQNEQ